MQDDVVARNWRDLIRPRRLDVEEDTLTATYGRFYCEPLERGFGTTLGNALRRVLLSSLQGAAITSIRIDGVLHEFSTIPGVMEDVATVVLNLKDVRVRMNTEGPKTIRLRKAGAGQVTAGDFTSADQTVEVMNPDHKICTLGPDSEFELEATVGLGKGYVLADKNKTEEMPIGTIPIDSVFSPIRRVNYTVTPARVGRETDFDRLNLELWTDGAIEPGTRRFLVRLSKPTQTEPIPKHTVDIHLTVSSVVGEEGDLAKMRYSIEQDSMVRRVADDAGTPTVAGDEWLLDRMIATKQAFAAQ